jgi:protease IV
MNEINEMYKKFYLKDKLKNLRKNNILLNVKIITRVLFLIFIFLIMVSIFNLLTFSKFNSNNKIAIINLNEEITNDYIDDIVEEMETINKDKDINHWKEIILVINSGGGSPSASEEFSEYIKDYNKNKLKINIYVENIAASGAYYIASSIKPINSNRNAIVGSIGVIMPGYNINSLANKIGIKETNIAVGKYKSPISYFKETTKENKDYLLKQMLNPTYKNFIERVSENRNINKEKISEFAEGKIYIASMPEIKGILIDKINTKIGIKNELSKKYKNVVFEEIEKKKDSFSDILNSKINFKFNISFDQNKNLIN